MKSVATRCKVAVCVALLLNAFASVTYGQQSTQQQLSNSLSDTELLEKLASPDTKTADRAVDMIIARGERMIAPLMKLKGDRRAIVALLTRDTSPANLMFTGTGDPRQDEKLLKLGKLVTMEVAAIYLISAIYFESQRFSQSPYLTDPTLPAVKQKAANTRKLIDRAWKATEKWYRTFTEVGMQKLRAAEDFPLKGSKVEFW